MSAPSRVENIMSLMDLIEYMVGGIPLTRDEASDTVGAIFESHKQIHDGNFYTYSAAATIGAGTSNALLLVIQPAANTEMHVGAVVVAKGGGWADMYENITHSGGTVVTPFNNNRLSAKTAGATIKVGGNVTDFGTLLQARAVGASAPGAKFGAETAMRSEWILNPAYKYLMRFYADNSDTEVSMEIEFYEVETQ